MVITISVLRKTAKRFSEIVMALTKIGKSMKSKQEKTKVKAIMDAIAKHILRKASVIDNTLWKELTAFWPTPFWRKWPLVQPKDEREIGWKEGRTDGKSEWRTDRWTDWPTEYKTCRTDGRTDKKMEGRMPFWMVGKRLPLNGWEPFTIEWFGDIHHFEE